MVYYVLELNADETEAREMLWDNGVPEEEINEQEIDHTINNLNDMIVDDFMYSFPKMIEGKGYKVGYGKWGYWMIFMRTENRLIAEVMVQYTFENDLEILVDTSNSQVDMTEGIHEVLLELTAKKLN